MNPNYNQNYTREEVDKLVCNIHQCVEGGCYTISLNENREKNRRFIDTYNLRIDKQKSILLGITTDDFCYSLENTNPGYEHETLYVFGPTVQLHDADDTPKDVSIYTKFNLLHTTNGKQVFVISFHEPERPLEYLFK